MKRKATTAAKIEPSHFDELKEQYLLDIKAVVEMEKVPSELVFNWDHTGINIVPGSQWTMEQKGSKRVELAGLNDKRQITAVFCATLAGEFLPVQLIYQGKITANLPRFAFPDDWDITFTPQGWIQDFLRGGSEHRGVSLKQGVWGHSPPEAIGFFVITTPKSCLL